MAVDEPPGNAGGDLGAIVETLRKGLASLEYAAFQEKLTSAKEKE
jgi:hypothetical protein